MHYFNRYSRCSMELNSFGTIKAPKGAWLLINEMQTELCLLYAL